MKNTPNNRRACEMYDQLCMGGHTHESAATIVKSTVGVDMKRPKQMPMEMMDGMMGMSGQKDMGHYQE